MIVIFVFSLTAVSMTHSSAVPPKKQIRSGRFLAFDSDDAFLDLLDEMQDPLPRPSDSGDSPQSAPPESAQEFPFGRPEAEKIAVPTEGNGVTENGVFFFGGHTHRYGRPELSQASNATGNKTEEIKIFWSSVGDVVENSPFLPIQINVPDMISAVTAFLANSIPLLQRIRNPNEPRPIVVPSAPQGIAQRTPEREPFDDDVRNRGLEMQSKRKEEDDDKKRKKTKPKPKPTSKRIFKRPLVRPAPTSTEDLVKIWHGSQSGEAVKYKNMPITRKRFHVADREFFNFKNSDISNSPIMILNMPSRPMMYYKIKHHVSGENQQASENPQGSGPEVPTVRPPYQNVTSQISLKRKLKKENNKASKKISRRVKNNQKKKVVSQSYDR